MKTLKKILVVCLVLVLAVTAAACAKVAGIVQPVDKKVAAEAFVASSYSIVAAEQAEIAAFRYKFEQPVTNMHIWADLYQNGHLIGDKVDITAANLDGDNGYIALYTRETNGTKQEFALFATNGSGDHTRLFSNDGVIETGEAMSPRSTTQIEDAQVTELGEQTVLLVMHDGPDLDTEMTNDVNQTQQLIESSTYTLVLNCEFA